MISFLDERIKCFKRQNLFKIQMHINWVGLGTVVKSWFVTIGLSGVPQDKSSVKIWILTSPFKGYRSSRPEVFLRKGVLKICSKFTGEHPCRSVISIKLRSSFIEIALQHGCSPVNLLCIFRTPFPRNTSRLLLLGLRTQQGFIPKIIHLTSVIP